MLRYVLFLLLLTPSFAFAQEGKGVDLSESEKLNELVLIRQNVEMIDKLKERGVEVFDAERDKLLTAAAKLLDKEAVTLEELVELTGGGTPPPSAWQKFTGFLTFVNFMWFIGGILLFAGFMWVGGWYFLALIVLVPPKIWEALIYISCILLAAFGSRAEESVQMFYVLPAAMGLIAGLTLNKFNWWGTWTNYDEMKRDWRWEQGLSAKYFYHFATAVLALSWGGLAIWFNSPTIGFFAVWALMAFLGFACGMFPGCIYVGFTEDAYVLRTTFGAFVIASIAVFMHITGTTHPYYEVFSTGMHWWGFFCYYLGTLIMSSKWWSRSKDGYEFLPLTFILMQLLTVSAGVSALYVGSVYGMDMLLGIGGTFFGIYLLEKWLELPWKGIGWAWAMLGLGGLLYALAYFAKSHPEYFLFVAN